MEHSEHSTDFFQAKRFGDNRKGSEKKADVTENPKVFDHVGLLVNEPLSPP